MIIETSPAHAVIDRIRFFTFYTYTHQLNELFNLWANTRLNLTTRCQNNVRGRYSSVFIFDFEHIFAQKHYDTVCYYSNMLLLAKLLFHLKHVEITSTLVTKKYTSYNASD